MLDGWWAEAYTPEVGWALGDGREHGDDPARDAAEAETLYALLEQKVIPEYYSRDQNGIPATWVTRIRESMARLTPFFSANRSVCEYIDQYYLPAAAAYRERASGNGVVAADMVNWLRSLEQKWANLRLGEVSVASGGECHSFEVQVYLNGLKPIDVNVELYADEVNGSNPVRQGMIQGRQLVGAENGYLYNARVPAARPAKDYTVRVIPQYPGASIPLEISQILWQK